MRMVDWPSGEWSVQWYGTFSPANENRPSAEVKILLAGPGKGAPVRLVTAGVGDLCRLPLGTRVIDQVIDNTFPAKLWSGQYLLPFPGDLSAARRINAFSELPEHPNAYWLPPHVHKLVPEVSRSPLYWFRDERQKTLVLLPASEIARTCLLRSTTLAQKLTLGNLDVGLRALIEAPPKFDPETGRYKFRLQRGIGRGDAPIAALLSMSEHAQACFRHFFSVRSTKADHMAPNRKPPPVFLDFPPPLVGHHRIGVSGIPYTLKSGEKAFLALRIETPLIQDSRQYEVEEIQDDPEDALRPDAERRFQAKSQAPVEPPVDPKVNSRVAPHRSRPTFYAHSKAGELSFDRFSFTTIKQPVTLHRGDGQEPDPGDHDPLLSTATPDAQGKASPLASVDPNTPAAGAKRPPGIPPTFEELIGALKLREPPWQFGALSGALEAEDGEHSYQYLEFPAQESSFPYIGNRARRAMVATLMWGKKCVYILEIEHQVDEANKHVKRGYCTLVLAAPNGQTLHSGAFADLLHRTADRSGVWTIDPGSLLLREKLRHTHRDKQGFWMRIRGSAEKLLAVGARVEVPTPLSETARNA